MTGKLTGKMARSTNCYFRVPVAQIGYVRFIVEAYEGLAQVSSVPGRCEVRWTIPEDLLDDATALARALQHEIGMVAISRPADWPEDG